MTRFATGTVTRVLSERPGLQRVEVDHHPAYVLTALVGAVAPGDRVVVNTTAVDLGLGSGGWHVVHWNLAHEHLDLPGRGRVLKLRYTPLQADVGAAEDGAGGGGRMADGLGGMPVVACDLHSQVACVAGAFAAAAPGRGLAYVMTDSAALPMVLSDAVARLRAEGVLALTVSAGQAFGGDLEAVTVASALLLARGAGAEAAVVGPGPGAVGTGTPYGFGGLEVAAVLDVAAHLGGRPVVAVRWSGADRRARQRGPSHHTTTVLDLAHAAVVVPEPEGHGASHRWPARHRVTTVDPGDPAAWAAVETMGRGPADDPAFFRWSAAAGVAAAALLSEGPPAP